MAELLVYVIKEECIVSYQTSKTMLNKIRDDYGCKGEIIFKAALQTLIQGGVDNFNSNLQYGKWLAEINDRHNKAELEGKILFCTREFEIAILECAKEMAKVPIMDLLQSVQKEVWLSGEGIDYQRAIELLKNCLEWFTDDTLNERIIENLSLLGFKDYEIEEFGYGWLFEEEEE